MNKVIIPTGYMESGSSAITDLIREFREYDSSAGSFEYIFLHCPDGLFDLEDKLLIGNNALRSDEAIHRFEKCMRDLYEQRFWWFGNYKKNLHFDFMEITENYLKELIQYKPSGYWHMQQRCYVGGLIWMGLRRLFLNMSGGKIRLQLPLKWAQMEISFVGEDEFYEISRKYLNSLFNCLGLKERNLILDQLLLPHNLWRMEHYFGDNVECFVVERDPRDVFVLNKYVLRNKDEGVPYPLEPNVYCRYYKQLRLAEKMVDNPHVHRFYFEDLVYHYEETVNKIYQILSLKSTDHINKFKYFNPEVSIHNTQVFNKIEYQQEVKIIEEGLNEYLYDFPYCLESDIDKAF